MRDVKIIDGRYVRVEDLGPAPRKYAETKEFERVYTGTPVKMR
jgi:hypothetical protein